MVCVTVAFFELLRNRLFCMNTLLESPKLINFNNAEIEYQLTGKSNKKTILFIHGLGANLSQFEAQHLYFNSKFNVLSISLPGHGNSFLHKNYIPSEFTLPALSGYIMELLNELDIDKVHVVANSMGGNIGYEMLQSNPERINSLTTFGTSAEIIASFAKMAFMKFVFNMLPLKAISQVAKQAGQTEASRNKIKKMVGAADKRALISILPNLAKLDYLEVIKSTTTPSMIIKGDKDAEINKALVSTISEFKARGNFELYEMKSAGHYVNLDQPDLFNKVLEAFIEKC